MKLSKNKQAPEPVMDIYGGVHEHATVIGLHENTFTISDNDTCQNHVALYKDNHTRPPKSRHKPDRHSYHFDAEHVKAVGPSQLDLRAY